MQKGSFLSQPIPHGWNSFVYVLEGKALFGESYKWVVFLWPMFTFRVMVFVCTGSQCLSVCVC